MAVLLIANRGEIAIRIARAAREIGMHTVGIYAGDDEASLHTAFVDEAQPLGKDGAAAYLDGEAVLKIARETGATHIHPGYGFLSENAAFARRCEEENVHFIGPAAETLDVFGDKIRARQIAQEAGLPVLPGTLQPTSLEEARDFAAEHGAIMLKALAGGGGRGMRRVESVAEIETLYNSCQSEALQSFGVGDLYVEKLAPAARHIEVQVIGDDSGAVTHLWERDCSVQRRHQKLVEIAPAPALETGLRQRILKAAVKLARQVNYKSLGTMEFLVADDDFWFMEANPRLQVEHTITEEITGVDLVQAQIHIATGASLAELGLSEAPQTHGFAIQARVNLEGMDADGNPVPQAGTLAGYTPPGGPHVRVDGYGYVGYKTSLRYDSLLAKVIARGPDFKQAALNTSAALGEFHIVGVSTNLPLLRSILGHPAFVAGGFDTTLVPVHLQELLAAAQALGHLTLPSDGHVAEAHADVAETLTVGADELAVNAPLSGTVVKTLVEPGEAVHVGDGLMLLEAMKMEHLVRATTDGTLSALAVAAGDAVMQGGLLAVLKPGEATGKPRELVEQAPQEDWSKEVAEIEKRRQFAMAMGGPDKLARQKAQGKLNARQRIDALVEPGSFTEIGMLTGFAEYDEDGNLLDLTAANFVAGTARVANRKVVLGVDDFTLRAGSGDAAIHDKQIFLERYARDMRLPIIRLLDGASGGGSVKIAQELGYHYLPVNPGWDAVVETLSLVPVVSAALGSTVGLGAARLVMSHLALMIEDKSQIFSAGPPIVKSATNEDLDKNELGGSEVHRENGVVERVVRTEAEAFEVIRQFLSYLPRSVFHLPPVIEGTDPVARREESLLAAVPRNERHPYAIDPIIEAIFDKGSFFPYAEYGGSMITGLARLDGYPVGVITTDSFKGATITVEGGNAVTRLVDLCETFHLPIVSLTDQAGMAIGSVAEKRGTIRNAARAISAIYQARVPQAEIIIRRVFGVGGAGAVNRHRANRSWAWPSGAWGSLPHQGGIEAAFRSQLTQTDDPKAFIEKIEKQLEQINSPFRTAEKFGVQDIIDPRDSRALLCDWVGDAYELLPEYLGKPSFGTRP